MIDDEPTRREFGHAKLAITPTRLVLLNLALSVVILGVLAYARVVDHRDARGSLVVVGSCVPVAARSSSPTPRALEALECPRRGPTAAIW